MGTRKSQMGVVLPYGMDNKTEKKNRISPMNEDRNPEGNRTSLCGFDSLASRSGSKQEKEAQRRGLGS